MTRGHVMEGLRGEKVADKPAKCKKIFFRLFGTICFRSFLCFNVQMYNVKKIIFAKGSQKTSRQV